MDLMQAGALVRSMFAAHGRNVVDAVLIEYADAIAEAACETCAATVVERLRTRGVLDEDSRSHRFPTAPELRDACARMQSSVLHGQHVGRSIREERVGDVEAFWRAKAAQVLRVIAGGPEEALVLAAAMWWAHLPARIDWVAAEIEDPHFIASFATPELDWARGHATRHQVSLRQVADRMFARARRAEIEGEENLPPEVVDLEVAV